LSARFFILALIPVAGCVDALAGPDASIDLGVADLRLTDASVVPVDLELVDLTVSTACGDGSCAAGEECVYEVSEVFPCAPSFDASGTDASNPCMYGVEPACFLPPYCKALPNGCDPSNCNCVQNFCLYQLGSCQGNTLHCTCF
jgi:hypothetical protein